MGPSIRGVIPTACPTVSNIMLRTQKRGLSTPSPTRAERSVPRGVSKVSPYSESAESIFGFGFLQFHGFTTELSNQPKTLAWTTAGTRPLYKKNTDTFHSRYLLVQPYRAWTGNDVQLPGSHSCSFHCLPSVSTLTHGQAQKKSDSSAKDGIKQPNWFLFGGSK